MPSYAELLELETEVKRLREQTAIEAAFGLLAYKPHKKQDLFHRAGKYKKRYLRTGNRFGKSDCGGAEDCAWALGYRAWYKRAFDVIDGEGKVVRRHDPVLDAEYITCGIPKRPVKILIIVADWDKAEEIFTNQVEGPRQGKLFRFLPKSEIVDIKKNQSGKIAEVHVRSIHGGTSIIVLDTIRSYKGNKLGQESADFDVIHVDEPPPKDMYIANARGLMDRDGSVWFTCTPLMEQWINDEFIPEGRLKDDFDTPHVHTKEVEGFPMENWLLTGSTRDNPYITARAIAMFASDLTEEQRQTRIDGRPAAFTGCIYPQFIREDHIYDRLPAGWVDPFTPPLDYTVRLAIDTHPSKPMAVLFAATSPNGYTYFYNEIFEKIYVPQLIERIWQRLKGHYPEKVLLEQAAYNDTPFDGQRISDAFYAAQMPVTPAVKDLAYGIQKTQFELTRRDGNGIPFMLFSSHLYETIREFDRYVWHPETGKPIDKDDHMMENLYRLVLGGFHYIEPEIFIPKAVKTLNVNSVKLELPGYAGMKLPGQSKYSGLPALNDYKRDRYRR